MQTDKSKLRRQLEAASWGTFFVWVGFCFLVGISWGVGLLGVAVITLGTQAIRAAARVRVEGFWVVVGLLFAASGLWHLFDVTVDLGPVVLMAVGVAIVLSALFGKTYRHEH